MTTTAFKIDLILPAMGMKRFTSHRRNPTTIRAIRICMRGMFFLPFCLCCETLLRWPPELLQALSGAENVLPCFNSANGWTIDPDRPCHWRVVRCPQRSCASWKSSCRGWAGRNYRPFSAKQSSAHFPPRLRETLATRPIAESSGVPSPQSRTAV